MSECKAYYIDDACKCYDCIKDQPAYQPVINELESLQSENTQLKKENETLKEELAKEREFIVGCHGKLSGPNGWTNQVVMDVMNKMKERKEYFKQQWLLSKGK